jgi:hypothetical protein
VQYWQASLIEWSVPSQRMAGPPVPRSRPGESTAGCATPPQLGCSGSFRGPAIGTFVCCRVVADIAVPDVGAAVGACSFAVVTGMTKSGHASIRTLSATAGPPSTPWPAGKTNATPPGVDHPADQSPPDH